MVTYLMCVRSVSDQPERSRVVVLGDGLDARSAI